MFELEIRLGAVEDETGFDAVVVPNDTEMQFAGRLSGWVSTTARNIVTEAKKQAPVTLGEVIVTNGHGLAKHNVLHPALMGYRLEDLTVPLRKGSVGSEKAMRDAVRKCLDAAERLGCVTMGWPSLAPDVPGFPDDEAAMLVVEVLFEWVAARPTTKIERAVILCADEDELATFQAARASVAALEEVAHEAQERAGSAAAEEAERQKAAKALEEKQALARAQAERERAERERLAREQAERDNAANAKRMLDETQKRKRPEDEATVIGPSPLKVAAAAKPAQSAQRDPGGTVELSPDALEDVGVNPFDEDEGPTRVKVDR